MENFRIVNAGKDPEGRHTLHLFIHEHEAEATFATEENPVLLPRLKQILFDTYAQNIATAKSV